MVFAGIAGKEVGVHPLGYLSAMVLMIGLWLTVPPATGAASRLSIGKAKRR
jgi:hypothetical protein